MSPPQPQFRVVWGAELAPTPVPEYQRVSQPCLCVWEVTQELSSDLCDV